MYVLVDVLVLVLVVFLFCVSLVGFFYLFLLSSNILCLEILIFEMLFFVIVVLCIFVIFVMVGIVVLFVLFCNKFEMWKVCIVLWILMYSVMFL